METHIATYFIDIIALVFLYGLLYKSNILNNYRKRPFLFAILLTVLIILAEVGTLLAGNERVELRTLNVVCNTIGFALTPMIPIALIAILDIKFLQTHKVLLLPTLIGFTAAVLSPLFGFIFSIDADNQYERGKLFFIFVAVYIINLILLVIGTLHTGRMDHDPTRKKMIALTLFTIAGTGIQLVFPFIYSAWYCITVSLLLYFLLLSEYDSCRDTLTGLYNRAAFEKMAEEMKSRNAFSVIVLDIDDFKKVNDTYGHIYGDTTLKAVAAVFKKYLDHNYTCYRVGGDEFYIIGKETNREKLEYQFGIMTNALAAEHEKDSRLPSIAYGYSIFRGGNTPDLTALLKEADDQMYSVKKLHKDLKA